MNRFFTFSAIIVMVMTGILLSGVSYARGKETRYEVIITNITKGQIFSNPIVFSHDKDFDLFKPGYPASDELAALAEDGLTDPLSEYLGGLESVYDISTADSMVFPGDSVTVEIETQKRFKLLSVAGMLVTTNDAFFAVLGLEARKKRGTATTAPAYDAGSEFNSESCAYIPGPPCGNHVHDTEDAEGYVYLHSGVHGGNSLVPAKHDWQNPVATIMVRKKNK